MLTRAGIRTEVRTLSYSVYITRATSGGEGGKPEFSAFLLGIGAVSGDSLEPLVAAAHAQDKAAGLGANNRSGYANAEVDALIEEAMHTMRRRRAARCSSARPRSWPPTRASCRCITCAPRGPIATGLPCSRAAMASPMPAISARRRRPPRSAEPRRGPLPP